MRVAPAVLNALNPRLPVNALVFASHPSHSTTTRPLKRRRLATAASMSPATPTSPKLKPGALGCLPDSLSRPSIALVSAKLLATALWTAHTRAVTAHDGLALDKFASAER